MASSTYTLLPRSDEPKLPRYSDNPPCARSKLHITIGIFTNVLIFCAVAIVAFITGRLSVSHGATDSLHQHDVKQAFRYNRTFSESSPQTDLAWAELVPAQGGFFNYPAGGDERATFSVFHTIHCLNGIRESYWMFHDAAMIGRVVAPNETVDMMQTTHVRHCIDLLRQSLMCHADATIEVVDDALGGVQGWGVKHDCKDWSQLVGWAEEWQ